MAKITFIITKNICKGLCTFFQVLGKYHHKLYVHTYMRDYGFNIWGTTASVMNYIQSFNLYITFYFFEVSYWSFINFQFFWVFSKCFVLCLLNSYMKLFTPRHNMNLCLETYLITKSNCNWQKCQLHYSGKKLNIEALNNFPTAYVNIM